ncbi:hypothetical protein D3C80_1975590 [compost metagenome]
MLDVIACTHTKYTRRGAEINEVEQQQNDEDGSGLSLNDDARIDYGMWRNYEYRQ